MSASRSFKPLSISPNTGGLCMSVPYPSLSSCLFSSRWYAQLQQLPASTVLESAMEKLTNGEYFNPSNRNHVFAVLSQRFCLEPALAGSEAIELADRSVAHHMRLVTGFSTNQSLFYTHTPSEPTLVLAAISLLYKDKSKRYPASLAKLSRDMCSAGLIEKGLLGELAVRVLLLTARDHA